MEILEFSSFWINPAQIALVEFFPGTDRTDEAIEIYLVGGRGKRLSISMSTYAADRKILMDWQKKVKSGK